VTMSQVDLFSRLQRHIDWRARMLDQGRYQALASSYCLPVHVQLGSFSFTIKTREDLILSMHRKRLGLLRHGLSLPKPRLLAHDLHPHQGVRRVWIQWDAEREGEHHDSLSIFGLMEQDRDFLLCSMEYKTMLLPEFEKPSAHRKLRNSR